MLLSIDDIVKLLDFDLNTTYMTLRTKFTNKCMVQRWGFPVSVLVASMMESVEDKSDCDISILE